MGSKNLDAILEECKAEQKKLQQKQKQLKQKKMTAEYRQWKPSVDVLIKDGLLDTSSDPKQQAKALKQLLANLNRIINFINNTKLDDFNLNADTVAKATDKLRHMDLNRPTKRDAQTANNRFNQNDAKSDYEQATDYRSKLSLNDDNQNHTNLNASFDPNHTNLG